MSTARLTFVLILLQSIALFVSAFVIPTSGPYSGGHLKFVSDPCVKTHIVQSGQTCYEIAKENGLTTDALISLNSGFDCDRLFVSSSMCVSNGMDPLPGCSRIYSVQEDDTCYDIAAKHGVQLANFYRFNPGIKCQELEVNQKVCLSYADKDSTTSVEVGVIAA